MSAAIHFHPEGYTTQGPKLMGRNAAGESFLRGLLTHGRRGPLTVHVEQEAHARVFEALARQHGREEPVEVVGAPNLPALSKAGALYLPGPSLAEQAWLRARTSPSAWSLCGITHTTASALAMDAITALSTAPVHAWDALICTSNAVRSHVTAMLDAQEEHLRARLGATRFTRPQLPVIPLGVHADDFRFTPDQRAAARQALGLAEDDRMVLFVGRLSFHAKAHPLPMYQALEAVARRLPGRKLVLVECGWFANEPIRVAYEAAAQAACPSVRRQVLDGRLPEARQQAWAAADMFCSLSDNIQETFGIVPIEAMAAGLPVVASNWDGYRDTVRDGIDGVLVPTWMAPPGTGADLAFRHAAGIDSYDRYCGYTASHVAVDIDATARALESLLTSPERCRAMGEAGRARVAEHFDWKSIIPRYEALWDALAERRRAAGAPPPQAWPARMDPFTGFQHYPSQPLRTDTRIVVTGPDALERLRRWQGLMMVNYAAAVLPPEAQVRGWLDSWASGEATCGSWLAGQPRETHARCARGLVWLAKLGIVRLVPRATAADDGA